MVDRFIFDDEFATPAEWARLYRSHHLQVVPAFMPGEAKGDQWKRPLLKAWTQYQDTLVTDEVFAPWYGPTGMYRQRKNMGVICGKASGNLMVVDLDIHKKADALHWWLNLLELHNARLDLETVEQQTGGGGLQKLFLCPPGYRVPTCKTKIGVDIRGQGGFAMLAPSLHESGKAYEWLAGRSPDEVEILMAPEWLLEAVDALVLEHGGQAGVSHETSRRASNGQHGAYDGFGHQTDGREEKMRTMVWAAVITWRKERSDLPSEAEQRLRAAEKYTLFFDDIGPQRQHPLGMSKMDMIIAEGHGPDAFWAKWQYAMRKWDTDVAMEAARPGPQGSGNGQANWEEEFAKANNNAQAPGAVPDIYPYLDVDQILNKADPVWAVDDLVNERALGFIFGPPGSLKTFLALDLALSIAAKSATWWNRKINRHGAVIYLCREGTSSFKFRIKAWEAHRKARARGQPFYLIEHPTNFMRPEDVVKVMETIRAIAGVAGTGVAAVFVDTVSRVLPGAKENQQEDMSLFVGACEHIQQAFDCIVVGLHHTNKNGGIRGSTVIPGAGDFLIETRREPGAMVGSVVLVKIKDGEDGLELPFKVTKVELGGILPRSSLMVDPDGDGRAEGARRASADGLPDRMVCREILAALELAWINQMPWSSADNGARPAVRLVMARWSLKREPVRRLLDGWMANGIIEYAIYDTKAKAFGYRKLIDL